MGFEVISEEGWEDYEVYTCDTCGWSIALSGVGGDVAECPKCLEQEYAADAEFERQREPEFKEGDEE